MEVEGRTELESLERTEGEKMDPGVDEGLVDEEEAEEAEEDEDEDDDDLSEVGDEELAELKAAVDSEQGAWSYDAYESLVKALRGRGDFDDLQTVREAMSAKFPLAPDARLEWANDLEGIGRHQDALKVLADGERDYLSVPLFVRHIEIAIACHARGDLPREEVLRVCEDAITSAGLELRHGSRIWRIYRNFQSSASGGSEELEKQLLARQLRCPLRGMEVDVDFARSRYPDVLASRAADVTSAQATVAQLLEADRTLEAQEAAIVSPGAATDVVWSGWRSLLALEASQGDLIRVKIAHERALLSCFLLPEAWHAYSQFVGRTVKDKPGRVAVLQRAVRNCPWDEDLWCALLRALEDVGSAEAQVVAAFEDAQLQATLHQFPALELSLCLLQYARRCGERAAFLDDYLPLVLATQSEGSPGWCSLLLLAAKIVAARWQLHAKMEELLERVLKQRGKEAFWWVEYGALLHRANLAGRARKLFRRGTFVVSPEGELTAMGAAWLDLESVEGTLAEYEEARERIVAQTAVLSSRKRPHEQRHDRATAKRSRTAEPRNVRPPSGSATVGGNEMQVERPRRERGGGEQRGAKEDLNQAAPGAGDRPDGHAMAGEDKKQTAPEGNNEEEEAEMEPVVEANTVYVSNLSFSLSKEQLREQFEGIPGFKEARLIVRKNGGSYGYGYVEFESDEGVVEALKLHKHSVMGRQMLVKRSKPSASGRKPGAGSDTRPQRDRRNLPDRRRQGASAGASEHSKRRPLMSFRPHRRIGGDVVGIVPRSVKMKNADPADGNSAKEESTEMDVEKPERLNRSQDDFRNMFKRN